MSFLENGCLAPFAPVEGCDPTPPTKTTTRAEDIATFEPFMAVMPLECSALSGFGLDEIAEAGLAAVREYVVGNALWSGGNGALTTNPNLLGSDTTGQTWADPTLAVGALEQRWAVAAFGRPGVLHVAPAFAPLLVEGGGIYRDGGRWRTPAGNAVSISPGYVEGVSVAAGQLTGPLIMSHAVHHGTAPMATLRDTDRSVNTLHVFAESAELVAFDPCTVLSEALDTTP